MSSSPGLLSSYLSQLPLLLAALCEALNADLEIDALSLLCFIAHKKGVSAKSIIDLTYRRLREALRKAGLIYWYSGMVLLTDEGAEVVAKIAAALAGAAKPEPEEVAAV